MPSSESDLTQRIHERRTRWLAIVALVFLVPCTVVATGWRDLREIFHARQLHPVDVAPAQNADYAGASVRLVGLDPLPLKAGLQADRTFIRTRLLFQLRDPYLGRRWLDCRLEIVDAAGHSWAAIDTVPDLLQRMMAKPGEPKGTRCGSLAVSNIKSGREVVVDAYYLVPRPLPPDLRVTLSTREGRPAYLRFALGGER
ncbi:hypothetical protein J1G33_00255 [Pseudomonas sp. P867]|uniref:hypothetical protein n=1 Tax=unclassified Pseudomonas TaxID=196821 RepID=UPI0016448CF4|nr:MULTISPECIES: hypothetical protein [unclassified Pseudomonas]MBV4510200.1 hypothetical protein [Pseudomonas sp. SWRI22]MBY8968811.1 hypothetical protein [Pseudomonas sp. P867]